MLNLFDYLTKEDRNIITTYIQKYGGIGEDFIGIDEYLYDWAESNKKLFRLLGGQLIYKIPYKYRKNEDEIRAAVQEIIWNTSFFNNFRSAFYRKLFFALESDKEKIKDVKTRGELYPRISGQNFSKIFVSDYASSSIQYPADIMDRLVMHTVYFNNRIDFGVKFRFPQDNPKILQLTASMKPMKAIRKIIEYFKLTDEDPDIIHQFDEFCTAVSMVFNDKEFSGQLCLSIHPMDFLTMSDNANGWSSCMSWVDKGCYRIGSVEMMNSNNVICAYLENPDHRFKFDGEMEWNSKSYRQLFYCTPEIIVSGKSYPIKNEDISKDILTILRDLAKQNWNQTYTYGIEEYHDMDHIGSHYRMDQNKRWREFHNTKKHNIIFYAKGMYNDMFHDHEQESGTRYFCVRNKVKKNTIITYSGKAPCLCCGGQVIEYNEYLYDNDEEDEYIHANSLICPNCLQQRTCSYCDRTVAKENITILNGRYFCRECWEKYIRSCPDCGESFEITRWTNGYNQKVDYPFVRMKPRSQGDDLGLLNPHSRDIRAIWTDSTTTLDGYPYARLCACEQCAHNLVTVPPVGITFEDVNIPAHYTWEDSIKIKATIQVFDYTNPDPVIKPYLARYLKTPEFPG